MQFKNIEKTLMAPKLINKSKNGLISEKKRFKIKIDKKIKNIKNL